jgi:uncharacterized protein YcgI (DUF1989 family)
MAALTESPGAANVIVEPGGCIAAEMAAGQVLRVTDVEGQQVGDLVAFSRENPQEKFWISNTIRLNGTIYLTTGHTLYSELSRPMLRILASTGDPHDLLAGSCNAQIDKVRYGADDHQGCVENFCKALSPWGITRPEVPMSFNLFMNCPVQPGGGWSIEEPRSQAGDYVEFVAEMDLIVAMSNCPQDLNPCNSGKLKPLRWEIFDR